MLNFSQDEPLIIKILDYDTYSANDAIGKVSLSLSPLLLQNGTRGMNGWVPIYDTMNGIRGEVLSITLYRFSKIFIML